MNEVLIHICAPGGNVIFAQADGSSGPELFRTISSNTVTCWPLVIRVTTSLLSLAWPRTLTLLATTDAGPATSGTVLSSGAGAFFFATAFFFPAFFFAALTAGAFVLVDAGATVPAIGVVRGAEGGGLVACCANTLVESITPRINQQLFFITQPIRELISGSVNIRHLPGRSSPSLIFPIWTRCNRFTVTRCDSNSRRTSWYLPWAISSSTTLCDWLAEISRAFSAFSFSPR